MKYLIEKDKKKRQQVLANETFYLAAKANLYNRSSAHVGRSPKNYAYFKHNFSSTTVSNRCVLSGRPRAVYRFGRVSRIFFRRLAVQGLLSGIRKSSW